MDRIQRKKAEQTKEPRQRKDAQTVQHYLHPRCFLLGQFYNLFLIISGLGTPCHSLVAFPLPSTSMSLFCLSCLPLQPISSPWLGVPHITLYHIISLLAQLRMSLQTNTPSKLLNNRGNSYTYIAYTLKQLPPRSAPLWPSLTSLLSELSLLIPNFFVFTHTFPSDLDRAVTVVCNHRNEGSLDCIPSF